MSNTTKKFSERDSGQTLQASFNDVDSSLTTNGFLAGKIGRKVAIVISTTSTANDTTTITFSESGSDLYAYKCIYTDGTRSTLISAERIS
jgi:hypothetical protein